MVSKGQGYRAFLALENRGFAGSRIRTSEKSILLGTWVNKGMKKVRDGRLRNTTNADGSKEKGHKIRAATCS